MNPRIRLFSFLGCIGSLIRILLVDALWSAVLVLVFALYNANYCAYVDFVAMECQVKLDSWSNRCVLDEPIMIKCKKVVHFVIMGSCRIG